MSRAATIAYNLRIKKSVDRNIFVDLLQRTCNAVSPQPVVYVSMGGPFVQDQADVHAALGLKDLISFDGSLWVVDRQMFNRPVSYISCLHLESQDIIQDLEGFFTEHIGEKRCAFWFDYTDAAERGTQLREMRSMVSMLRHGDVLKITMNAFFASLGNPEPGSGKTLKEHRFECLQDQLNDYFPAETTVDDMTDTGFPSVLGTAFALACDEGMAGGHEFIPLTSFKYADGQQMVSFCGVIVESAQKDSYLERLGEWGFGIRTFSEVREIDVPTLSLREKTEIDRLIFQMPAEKVREELKVSLGETHAITDALIKHYCDFYRFYPKFARISAV